MNTPLDQITINFNADQLWLLNICLGFLMFGVALDLKPANFKYLLQHPKLALVGLSSQLLLLPILTLCLIFLFRPPVSVALGMVIVSACPGGNVSNYAVHLAKGNAALSILLTSITTMASVIVTPGYFLLLTPFIPGIGALDQGISVSPTSLINTIFSLIIIPLAMGMVTNYYFPKLTSLIKKPISQLSMLIFIGFVLVAINSNFEIIYEYIHLIFGIVFIHNFLALSTGYWWARWNGLNTADTRAITLETGIQNSGLGLILIFNFFDGLGGMAIVAAWWGIWHLVSAFTLANWWARSIPTSEI